MPTRTHQNSAARKPRWRWGTLSVLSLALAIIIIDTTILNVSLRAIITDLKTDIQSIQWVITIYALMLSAFTITGGRLGDLAGRKRMFMLGAAIFALGSFIASVSPSVGVLILGEAIIEGVGAALMLPATASLLVSTYRGRERAIAFGIWGGIAGAAAAVGPILGGYLTTNYTWRWAFRINVFIAALLLLGSFMIQKAPREKAKSFDLLGVIFSAIGLFLVVFGVIQSSTSGWIRAKAPLAFFGFTLDLGRVSVVPFAILIGAAFIATFLFWESYVARHRTGTPLVSLKIFGNRQFTTGVVTVALISLSQTGLLFTLPVFFQSVRGLSAFQTGIAFLPLSITALVIAPLTAILSKYVRPKLIVQAGLVLNVVSFIVLRLTLSTEATIATLAPGFILFGAALGAVNAQINNITLSAVEAHEAGEASGINNTLRQVGSSFGTAIIGAVFLTALINNLIGDIRQNPAIPESVKGALEAGVSRQTSSVEFGSGLMSSVPLPQSVQNEIVAAGHTATVQADKTALDYGIGFAAAGFIISFLIPSRLKGTGSRQDA